MNKRATLFLFTFLIACVLNVAFGGTGAIPSGPNVKLLKDNLRFKNTDTRIMTNDSDDPTVVAKSAAPGSIYIRSTTGVMYQKQDAGSSTNWQALLIGAPGLGTDECVARWDGTGLPNLNDSLFCITDAGVGTGLTQQNIDNLRLDGNQLSATNANGNLELEANGTGEIHITDPLDVPAAQAVSLFPSVGANNISMGAAGSNFIVQGDLTVNGTTTTVNSTTLDVDAAKVNVNVDGTQAAADLNDSGIEVTMTDATNAGLAYNSSFASRFMIGEVGAYQEVITSGHTQTMTAKIVDHQAGAVGSPSAYWNGDTDTGFFSDAADHLQFSAGGAEVLEMDGTSIDSTVAVNAPQLNSDNLRLDGNTISSQDVNGNIILDPNGTGNVQLPDLTVSQPAYIDASGNLVSQDLDLTADVTGVLPIANGGTNSSTALNNDRIMVSSGGSIVEAAALTNGQLLIGSTGAAPVAANISGTVNQVNVTNGAGSITLSTPQDIHTGASPTFVGATLSGLNANEFVVTNGTSGLTTQASIDLTSDVSGILPVANGGTGLDASGVLAGQILIGNDTNNDFDLATLTGTANQVNVTNADGSITLSTPQDIHTGASPTFVGATLSGLTQNSILFAGVGGAISEDNANFSWTDGTDTLAVNGVSNFDNLRIDGNTLSSTDANGSVVLNPNGTGTIDLNVSGALWSFDSRDTQNLALVKTATGTPAQLEVFSNDGDGTDANALRIFALGTVSDITNSEWIDTQWDTVGSNWEIHSDAQGTGTVRDIEIFTGANTDQIRLEASSGEVGINEGSPSSTLDVGGAIESNGVGVLADNLITNGGAEDGVADWTCTSGTCSSEPTTVLYGGQSLKVDLAATNANIKRCFSSSEWVNKMAQVSCQVKSSIADVQLCYNNDSATTDDSGDEQCIEYNGSDDWVKMIAYGGVNTGEEICIHIKSTASVTDALFVDQCKIGEMEVDGTTKIYKQYYTIEQGGSSLTDRADEIEFNLGTATIVDEGDSVINVTDNAANTRTEFNCLKPVCYIDIAASGVIDTDNRHLTFLLNGSIVQSGTVNSGANRLSGASAELKLVENDRLTIAVATNNTTVGSSITNNTDPVKVTIVAKYELQKSVLSDVTAESTITEWKQFTPTFTNVTLGNGFVVGSKRRVGDSLEMNIILGLGSTSSVTGTILLDIPDGLSADTVRVTGGELIGNAYLRDADNGSNNDRAIYPTIEGSTTVKLVDRTVQDVNATTPITFTTNDRLYFRLTIPIESWKAKPQIVGTFKPVVNASKAYIGSANSINSSTLTYVDFDSIAYDPDNNFVNEGGGNVTTAGTGFHYLVPSDGRYKINMQARYGGVGVWNAGETADCSVRVDGSTLRGIIRRIDVEANVTDQEITSKCSGTIDAFKGEKIEFALFQNSGSSISLSAFQADSFVTVEKIDQAGVIAKANKPRTCIIYHQEASGVNGGSCDSAAGYQARTLNTLDSGSDCGFLNLSSNRVTLPPGNYTIDAKLTAFRVNSVKSVLYNITTDTPDEYSTVESSDSAVGSTVHNDIRVRREIASSRTYEFRTDCTATNVTTGFGPSMANGDPNIYSIVKITKE